MGSLSELQVWNELVSFGPRNSWGPSFLQDDAKLYQEIETLLVHGPRR